MNYHLLKSRFESTVPTGGADLGPRASRTVGRIAWALALISLVMWSLVAFGAHAMLAGSAAFLQTQLDWFEAYPWLQPWLEGGLGLTEGVALAITWLVWGLGTTLILLGAWLLPKAFRLFGGAIPR